MDETIKTVLSGTASMLSIFMCVMVIFFLALLIKQQKKFDVKAIYKHWVLFTGMSFVLASIIFDLGGRHFFAANGFDELHIKLLSLYNNFARVVGIGFVFSWALFFMVMDVSDHIDAFIEKFRKKKTVH